MLIMLPIWSLYSKKRSAIFLIRTSLEVRPRSERTRALQMVATYSGTRRKFIHARTFVGSRGSQNPFGLESQYVPRPADSRYLGFIFSHFGAFFFADCCFNPRLIATHWLLFLLQL